MNKRGTVVWLLVLLLKEGPLFISMGPFCVEFVFGSLPPTQ